MHPKPMLKLVVRLYSIAERGIFSYTNIVNGSGKDSFFFKLKLRASLRTFLKYNIIFKNKNNFWNYSLIFLLRLKWNSLVIPTIFVCTVICMFFLYMSVSKLRMMFFQQKKKIQLRCNTHSLLKLIAFHSSNF